MNKDRKRTVETLDCLEKMDRQACSLLSFPLSAFRCLRRRLDKYDPLYSDRITMKRIKSLQSRLVSNNKQLLDEVFVISGIIKVQISE